MLLENHQQVYQTFFDFYIYQDNILLKKDLKQLCDISLYQSGIESMIC